MERFFGRRDLPELPQKAKKWLEERERLAGRGVKKRTWSVDEFRDLYVLDNPDSVGVLDIPNRLFVALLHEDVYQVSELERYLDKKHLGEGRGNKHVREIRKNHNELEQAVGEWQQAREEYNRSRDERISRIVGRR